MPANTEARDAMQVEMAKLNASQRSAMRRIVASALDCLRVTRSAYKTRVCAKANGFHYLVTLGPRGRVMRREVVEA